MILHKYLSNYGAIYYPLFGTSHLKVLKKPAGALWRADSEVIDRRAHICARAKGIWTIRGTERDWV